MTEPIATITMSDEDLAMDRVIEQHDLIAVNQSSATSGSTSGVPRYSHSYRLAVGSQSKKREGYDGASSDGEGLLDEPREAPPDNYTCHRCGMTGGKPESHWIWECPTNDDPDHTKKVRTAKGIPREFLKKVTVEEGQEQSAGGVTFTLPGYSGHYIMAHEATLEDRKLRVGDTVREKVVTAFTDGARGVEDSLKCPLCRQIFRQALLAPCCGATFCSDCIVDRLASASVDNSLCPVCRKEVYAHELVANVDIRNQVEQISRASKANALAVQKEEQRPKSSTFFEVDASLKDRVNRPKKHAIEDAPGTARGEGQAGALRVFVDPSWQPLGFGPMLSADQFAQWQQLARAGLPEAARARHEDWQRRSREVLPAPAPLSKESFEEWQKSLREDNSRKRPHEVLAT